MFYYYCVAVLDETNYLLPRPLSDTYSVPPAARPLLPIHLPVTCSAKTTPPVTPTRDRSDYQNTVVPPIDITPDSYGPEPPFRAGKPVENAEKPSLEERAIVGSESVENRKRHEIDNVEREELQNYEIPVTPDRILTDENEYRVPKGEPTPLPNLPVFLPPLQVDTNYRVPPAARPFTPSSSEPASPLRMHFATYLQMHSPGIRL